MMGGSWPVSIQTMWKSALDFHETGEFERTLSRIDNIAELGCDVVRFAVPDADTAESLGRLARESSMPLVADIHFDWKLALRCMDFPIAKVRINPGNIGARWKVAEVVAKAKGTGTSIRIGVNAGSLPEDLRQTADRASAVVEAAERELAVFDELDFANVLVSMKVSDVEETITANRLFASRHDIPLHLGVTEAGPLIPGIVRNTAALVPLLHEGIGATIRVSLSDSMESEVMAAREILSCAGMRPQGVKIVSCPRCGRAGFDTHEFTRRWAPRLYALKMDIVVAIMGCAVNGPGEARHADLGITGAGDKIIIFRRGEVVRTVLHDAADEAFARELEALGV